jgi:aconitase A
MGIRCIVASSFADIFFNNCFKNGMLPIPLPREQVLELLDDAEQLKELEIDLEQQKIIREDGSTFDFEVDAFRKRASARPPASSPVVVTSAREAVIHVHGTSSASLPPCPPALLRRRLPVAQSVGAMC